jgi:Short C-terminal domain
MQPAPEQIIRRYLEGHGGEVEVPAGDLRTTWRLQQFTPDGQQRIEKALREAGITVSPQLQGLGEDDQVTLRLTEEERHGDERLVIDPPPWASFAQTLEPEADRQAPTAEDEGKQPAAPVTPEEGHGGPATAAAAEDEEQGRVQPEAAYEEERGPEPAVAREEEQRPPEGPAVAPEEEQHPPEGPAVAHQEEQLQAQSAGAEKEQHPPAPPAPPEDEEQRPAPPAEAERREDGAPAEKRKRRSVFDMFGLKSPSSIAATQGVGPGAKRRRSSLLIWTLLAAVVMVAFVISALTCTPDLFAEEGCATSHVRGAVITVAVWLAGLLVIPRIQQGATGPAAPGRDDGADAGDPLESLRRLGELRDQGVVSDDEFQQKKAELLKRIE